MQEELRKILRPLQNALLSHKLLVSAVAGVTVAVIGAFIVAGRSNKPAQAAPRPLDVEVVRVEQKDVPVYSEWIGTTEGIVNADIKAEVTGYLLKQDYKEGSFVKKGQLLFELDPRPFQAAVDQANGQVAQFQGQLEQAISQVAQAEAQLAQANSQLLQSQAQLAQAQANQVKTQLDVNKYAPLAEQKAVTQQDLDNAVQGNVVAKAAVRTAQLNLGFTRIVSPIDGIAGIAQAQVGNLISTTSAPLTTVSTVDPIKVYFTLSEQQYLNFTKRNLIEARRGASVVQIELELILSDGSTYPEKGSFFFADRQVDQKTGAIRMAGIFPNPGNVLRPGQYGRVRAVTATKPAALLVPQRAVSELQGSYQVAVVGTDNKVEMRTVKVGERSGSQWVIEDGLKAGETVVVEGTQKIKPGAVVNPKTFTGKPTTN